MKKMSREAMKQRTKQYALRIIRLVCSLPRTQLARHIGGQLLRSGTSVASNYRAACRGRSRAEFLSKLGTVEEEADESLFWQEVLIESGVVKARLLAELMRGGNEILSIVVASRKTTRARGG
jgi:four helix bundle protein